MNLDLDFSVVTRVLRGILNELRQKHIWPVAVALLAAVIAVPVVLSKSSTPAPTPAPALPTGPPASGTAIPTLSVSPTPGKSTLTGRGRDPFASAGTASKPTGSTSPAAAAAGAASTAAASVTSTLTGGNSGTTGSGSTGGGTSPTAGGSTGPASGAPTAGSGGNPPSITPGAKPKPAPTGLKPNQAYDVALAITNSAGGLDTIEPLERLRMLPTDQPLLVELGVLKGGNRVLFAVQPGTVVTGPGSCIPGPLDCEIISLGQDQTESMGTKNGTVALFAVTGITTQDFSSAAAANRARTKANAAGQALVESSSRSALPLFQYEPSLGSVVDLRNLTVGSS